MGFDKFDAMTVELIKRSSVNKPKKTNTKPGQEGSDNNPSGTHKDNAEIKENQGKLLLDATVAAKKVNGSLMHYAIR